MSPTTNDDLRDLAATNNVEVNASDTKADLVAKLDEANADEVDALGDDFGGNADEVAHTADAIKGGDIAPVGPVLGQVTTTEQPARDDEAPAVIGDAEVDDGTVRTNSAVEPIADVLVAGAGAPKPPPANVDRDGREVFPDGVAPTALATYDGPGAPTAEPVAAVEPDDED